VQELINLCFCFMLFTAVIKDEMARTSLILGRKDKKVAVQLKKSD